MRKAVHHIYQLPCGIWRGINDQTGHTAFGYSYPDAASALDEFVLSADPDEYPRRGGSRQFESDFLFFKEKNQAGSTVHCMGHKATDVVGRGKDALVAMTDFWNQVIGEWKRKYPDHRLIFTTRKNGTVICYCEENSNVGIGRDKRDATENYDRNMDRWIAETVQEFSKTARESSPAYQAKKKAELEKKMNVKDINMNTRPPFHWYDPTNPFGIYRPDKHVHFNLPDPARICHNKPFNFWEGVKLQLWFWLCVVICATSTYWFWRGWNDHSLVPVEIMAFLLGIICCSLFWTCYLFYKLIKLYR